MINPHVIDRTHSLRQAQALAAVSREFGVDRPARTTFVLPDREGTARVYGFLQPSQRVRHAH